MKTLLFWILKLIPAAILLMEAHAKVISHPNAVGMMETLGMGENGRMLIGVLEGIAAILLLIPRSTQLGAVLAFSLMLGAMIAHLTVLGCDLLSGQQCLKLLLVFIPSCALMYLRKEELPLLGILFNERA